MDPGKNEFVASSPQSGRKPVGPAGATRPEPAPEVPPPDASASEQLRAFNPETRHHAGIAEGIVRVGLYFHLFATISIVAGLASGWIGLAFAAVTLFSREPQWAQIAAACFTGTFFLMCAAAALNLPAPFLCLATPDKWGKILLIVSLLLTAAALMVGGGGRIAGDRVVSNLTLVLLILGSSLAWLYFLRRLAGAYHDGATAEQFNTLIAMAYAAIVLVLLVGGLIVCGTHLPQASPAEAGGLSARSGLLCIGSIVVLAILFLVVMLANNSVWGLTGVPWGIQYVKAIASLLGILAPEEE